MSTIQNEMILESLYEQNLEYLNKEHPEWDKLTLTTEAISLAREAFDNRL